MIWYFILGLIYGFYSVIRHWQLNPNKFTIVRVFFVFVLNGLFFPISFIMALKLKTFLPTKEENDRLLLLLKIKRIR